MRAQGFLCVLKFQYDTRLHFVFVAPLPERWDNLGPWFPNLQLLFLKNYMAHLLETLCFFPSVSWKFHHGANLFLFVPLHVKHSCDTWQHIRITLLHTRRFFTFFTRVTRSWTKSLLRLWSVCSSRLCVETRKKVILNLRETNHSLATLNILYVTKVVTGHPSINLLLTAGVLTHTGSWSPSEW